MESKLKLSKMESADLRQRLEDHLCLVFADKTITKYLAIDGCGPELQIIAECCDPYRTLPLFKLAYRICFDMDVNDRFSVLGKFHEQYAALQIESQGNRKILIFCALFIHEFANILAESLEWPD